ncbi:hypothetical protein BpHYR1_031909 [Brachionus plicatilis]|uniref:Uncharacterized protein n=1 Tax=Brachionus plicatilis TaxID=10195 RepID=A0A3M7R9K4_BRAPC|nr:hypothetical protein BpHYR1_031909 [Brachionus plicatilis]
MIQEILKQQILTLYNDMSLNSSKYFDMMICLEFSPFKLLLFLARRILSPAPLNCSLIRKIVSSKTCPGHLFNNYLLNLSPSSAVIFQYVLFDVLVSCPDMIRAMRLSQYYICGCFICSCSNTQKKTPSRIGFMSIYSHYYISEKLQCLQVFFFPTIKLTLAWIHLPGLRRSFRLDSHWFHQQGYVVMETAS